MLARYLPMRFIQNAFDDRLGSLINLFQLFVVDLLHEIELGVWKALFTHLIRILVAIGGNSIQLLNERYVSTKVVYCKSVLRGTYSLNPHDRFRKISTFGRSTIRPFHNNVSAQKKLAVRDYEDLLQVSIDSCFFALIIVLIRILVLGSSV